MVIACAAWLVEWPALRPSHGSQDAVTSLVNPCSIWGLTAAQLKRVAPVCVG